MLQIGGWVGGGGGQIVIPMPEALSFAESRRQKEENIFSSSMYVYNLLCVIVTTCSWFLIACE
jgi:hypothetical protein